MEVTMGNEINDAYREWLLTKVLIECWTTNLCAKYLGRDPKTVSADLSQFLKDSNETQSGRD